MLKHSSGVELSFA